MARARPEWIFQEDVSGYTPLHLAAVSSEEEQWKDAVASMAGAAIEKFGVDASRKLCKHGMSLKVFDHAFAWWEERQVARVAKEGRTTAKGPSRI